MPVGVVTVKLTLFLALPLTPLATMHQPSETKAMMHDKHNLHISTAHAPSMKPPILRRWKDLTPEQRHREIVRAVSKHNGQAVTLNMAPAFADYLVTAANPMRLIGKRMNAELNVADLAALPILLVLEATRQEAVIIFTSGSSRSMRASSSMSKGEMSGSSPCTLMMKP